MKKTNSKGFTLMEMLIVVAIIAVLVAIAIPTFSNALTKAKVATDKANVRAFYAEQAMKNMVDDTAPTAAAVYDGTTGLVVGGNTEVMQASGAKATVTITGGVWKIVYDCGTAATSDDFTLQFDIRS